MSAPWPSLVPCTLYVTFAVGGLMLATTSRVALFVVGGAALGRRFLGIRNVVAAGGREKQRPLKLSPSTLPARVACSAQSGG